MKKSVVLAFLFLVVISFGSALVDSDGDGYLDINNCAELQNISLNLVANYELIDNIDCTSFSNFKTIANYSSYTKPTSNVQISLINLNSFKGEFNGNGFSIINLIISSCKIPCSNLTCASGDDPGSFSGLFGAVGSGGYVHDVHLVNLTNTAQCPTIINNRGGIAGYLSNSAIVNCSVSGVVGESFYGAFVGGIVGRAEYSNISRSYSGASVYANSGDYGELDYVRVGGLVGVISLSNISESYSVGSVTATSVGGVVSVGGLGGHVVTAMYSGLTSYWNNITSGQATSVFGVRKNTTDMKTQSTYIGWNFTNIWAIDSNKNNGYPYLRSQKFSTVGLGVYRHLGGDIFILLKGQNNNLQNAISSGHFGSSYTGGSYSLPVIFGHNNTEVIVNVNGTVKTFAAALSDGSLMNTLSGRSPAVYTGYNLVHGEYATNVLVNNATTTINLQRAINDGWFYVVPTCTPNCAGKTCGDNGCGGTCGTCAEGYRCNSASSCEIFTDTQYNGCAGSSISACGPAASYSTDTYFFGCSNYANGICYGCTLYVWAGRVLFNSGTDGSTLVPPVPGFLVYSTGSNPGPGYMFYSWGGPTAYRGKGGSTLYCFDIKRRPST